MQSLTPQSRNLAADEIAFAEIIDDAEMLGDSVHAGNESSFLGLIELLLKRQRRLAFLTRDAAAQRELMPRLLAVGVIGYVVFGVAIATIFAAAQVWPTLTSISVWLQSPAAALIDFSHRPDQGIWTHWVDGSAVALIAAFTIGLIGANGVCLPSFYFYGLLAGVRTNMAHVATNAVKGMASGAVAVVGALPIYFAVVLGMAVFAAPPWLLETACLIGLTLPFIAGLYGTRSIYFGLLGMTDTLPERDRCRRTCFLRRLLAAWCICYTTVAPVMIFTLWELFSR